MALEWGVGQGQVTGGLVGCCKNRKLSPWGSEEPLSREGEVTFVLLEDLSGCHKEGLGQETGWGSGWTPVEGGIVGMGKGQKC